MVVPALSTGSIRAGVRRSKSVYYEDRSARSVTRPSERVDVETAHERLPREGPTIPSCSGVDRRRADPERTPVFPTASDRPPNRWAPVFARPSIAPMRFSASAIPDGPWILDRAMRRRATRSRSRSPRPRGLPNVRSRVAVVVSAVHQLGQTLGDVVQMAEPHEGDDGKVLAYGREVIGHVPLAARIEQSFGARPTDRTEQ